MSSTQRHELADILSVTTGILMSHATPPVDGLYRILNFMTGDSIFTHVLPRAADAATPALIAQHPFLEGLEPPRTPDGGAVLEALEGWLTEVEDLHGRELEIAPLEEWEQRNPVEELAGMMRPNQKTIVVDTDPQQSATDFKAD